MVQKFRKLFRDHTLGSIPDQNETSMFFYHLKRKLRLKINAEDGKNRNRKQPRRIEKQKSSPLPKNDSKSWI